MKLREKINSLKDSAFVKQMMVNSVYGTMELEQQGVSRAKIEQLYDKLQLEKGKSKQQ
ncbi:hypothetical protein [Mucilaginibacter pedocola]|uniref:hypothetical protein n=1 Tax=Mucilaginibacter pedocola TaxID=1792845 RepID=UPI0012DE3994|nr:hypothetical protein [Mucilaginibacter pedocola]